MNAPAPTASRAHWMMRALALALAATPACAQDSSDDDGATAADSGPGVDDSDGGALDVFIEGGGMGCDLTGTWGARGVTFTTADSPLAPGAQKTSGWSVIEIVQDGDDFTVKTDLPCGTRTTGDATVTMRGPNDELAPPGYQRRASTAGRIGTSIDDGEQCQVSFERIYATLGTSAGNFDPPGRVDGNPGLDAFEPLTEQDAEDWDEDGNPAMTYIITDSVLGSGSRFAMMRTWSQMGGPVVRDADEFLLPIEWELEDLVIEASSPFFKTEAVVRKAPHMAEYRRVDPAKLTGADDQETCDNLRAAMPHSPEPRDSI